MSATTPFRSGPEDDDRDGPELDPPERAAFALEAAWAAGGPPPDVADFWAGYAPGGELEVLSALIKADLKWRFHRGERPDVAAYLGRFAALREASERVISLVYEEYCLLEERGERPDPDSFAARYDPWRDSLLSQLRYHRMLSQVVGAVAAPARLPMPGERFRTFRLRSVLGRGGSACVYLALDEALGGREVALKVSSDRGKEPAIQGLLDHAHIVPVFSVTDDPETGLRGLCMPYRAGLALDEVIRRVDPASRPRGASALRDVVTATAGGAAPDALRWEGFPARGTYAEAAAWLVSVVARALSYAHGQGVLHRDVKPANVLLTARDGPQLLDFNLAHAPHAADQAESALRGGTLPYMAPEQLRAFLDPDRWGAVGAQADVYAAGLLLRELLTGRRPSGPDPSVPLPRAIRELLDRRDHEFGPARALNPDVPHALDAILARCLAFDTRDRYPDALALAEALERFVTRKRRTRRSAIAGAALLAVVASATWLPRAPWAGRPADLIEAAVAHLEQGDLPRAMRDADAAVAADPDSPAAYSARCDVLLRMKQASSALRDIDRAIALTSRDNSSDLAILRHKRGSALEALHRPGEAEAEYAAAVKKSPYLFTAEFALAKLAAARRDREATKRHLDKAVEAFEYRYGDSARPGPLAQLAEILRHRALAGFHIGDADRARAGQAIDERTKAGKPIPADERSRMLASVPLDFKHAQEDLAKARELIAGHATIADRDHESWVEAIGHFVAGNLASTLEDYPGAVEQFGASLRDLDALKARGFDGPEMDGTRRRVADQLRGDGQALARRGGATPGPN